jgi:hypothetical protein
MVASRTSIQVYTADDFIGRRGAAVLLIPPTGNPKKVQKSTQLSQEYVHVFTFKKFVHSFSVLFTGGPASSQALMHDRCASQ